MGCADRIHRLESEREDLIAELGLTQVEVERLQEVVRHLGADPATGKFVIVTDEA